MLAATYRRPGGSDVLSVEEVQTALTRAVPTEAPVLR